MQKRGFLLITLISALATYGALSGVMITQGVGVTKDIVGKSLRASAVQGWITVPTISAPAISHDATFFYLSNQGSIGTIGLAVVTPTVNMTALSVSGRTATLQVNGAGTVRVYNLLGEPATVTGGTPTYSEATKSTAIATAGAGVITITWNPQGYVNLIPSMWGYIALFGLIPFIGAAALVISAMNGTVSKEAMFAVISMIVGLLVGLFILAVAFG